MNLPTLRSRGEALAARATRPYRKLDRRSRITFWVVVLIHVLVFGVVMIITPRRIGEFFNDLGVRLRGMGWKGMLILSVAVAVSAWNELTPVLSSHPPLFGFSGSMTLLGFAYGVWPGFAVAAVASVGGAAIAFLSVRAFFLEWMRSFGASKSTQWRAFGHVMRERGWPLVAMIRWCPLPWAIGNGLFASIEAVEFWQFMLANVLYLPKLFIPVFIGSRLSSMVDNPDDPAHKDPVQFWLNVLSIVATGVFSVVTGLIIYRLTLAQMRKLEGLHEGCDPDEGELAAEALESTALLRDFDDEEELVAWPPTQGARERSPSIRS